MFNKSQNTPKFKEVETIIGPSVKVEGDFVGEGDVIVEGIVNGNLKTKKSLKVLSGAKITANIEAESAVIDGEIKGNIKVKNRLELGSSASIKGDIAADVLSIEAGAVFNGKCEIRGSGRQIEETFEEFTEKEEESEKIGKLV